MKNDNFAIPYSETIEVELTASAIANRKVFFSASTLPAGAVVCGLELVLEGRSPMDRPIEPNTYGSGAYLHLLQSNTERNKAIPFNSLKYKANYGVVHQLEPYTVNFQQSFIGWPAGSALGVGNSIVIVFHYYTKEAWEKMNTKK